MHVLHDVGDGEGLGVEAHGAAVGGGDARRVDVHVDGPVLALVVQVQQLRDNLPRSDNGGPMSLLFKAARRISIMACAKAHGI